MEGSKQAQNGTNVNRFKSIFSCNRMWMLWITNADNVIYIIGSILLLLFPFNVYIIILWNCFSSFCVGSSARQNKKYTLLAMPCRVHHNLWMDRCHYCCVFFHSIILVILIVSAEFVFIRGRERAVFDRRARIVAATRMWFRARAGLRRNLHAFPRGLLSDVHTCCTCSFLQRNRIFL